jgi:hypothetical protein
MLKKPCKHCARLTEQEQCSQCLKHYELYGHYPKDVQRRQVTGQPRVATRFCSQCGREL